MAYDLIKISALPETTPDESQDIVIGDGDYAKRIKYADVKADMVGTTPTYTTDTEPYLMRQTAHTGVVGKCALNKLVGGSLGWNQLCNGSSVTVPNGHKYYMKKSGTASIGASTGSALTGLTSGTDMVIDLTITFGSTIADYVYGLESATAGAGVAWLSRYINLGTYHAYDAGSIQSVQATAHVATGKNLLDVTKEASGSNAHIREYELPDLPTGTYTISAICNSTASTDCLVLIMYADGTNSGTRTFTNHNWSSVTVAANKPVSSLRIYSSTGYNTSQSNTVVITSAQLEFGSTATAYEPYNGHTYPLGSDTLRGIPQLVSNKLAFDGDIKTPDGTITRKYGSVDMGTLTWTYISDSDWQCFSTTGISDKALGTENFISAIYSKSLMYRTTTDKIAYGNANSRNIYVRDSSYNGDAVAFKAAMSGKYIVYRKDSDSTESSTSYQKIQTIDADGTESFTASSPVPVGHETQTPDNVLAALGWLGE